MPRAAPSQLCASFGGGLRTPRVSRGQVGAVLGIGVPYLVPSLPPLSGISLPLHLSQFRAGAGGRNAARGSLLSAKGTTKSSAEAQLPRHQDSVLTCRNQSPSPWLCAVSTSLDMSSMLCTRSPSCALYCPGAVITGAQSPALGLSACLNPLLSSVFFLLHPSFIHPFGLEGSIPCSSAGGLWPRWGAQLLGTPHSS